MRNGSRDDARFAVKYDARFAVTLPQDELLQLTSSSAMSSWKILEETFYAASNVLTLLQRNRNFYRNSNFNYRDGVKYMLCIMSEVRGPKRANDKIRKYRGTNKNNHRQ
jgi:hypothetical protein